MRKELALECAIEMGGAPDCGCPWEHWHVGDVGVCLDVHFEEDGSIDLRADTGDWEAEATLRGIRDMDEARAAAFAWVAPLIGEGDVEPNPS